MIKKLIFFFVFTVIYLLALYINQKIIWAIYFILLLFLIFSRHKIVYKPLFPLTILLIPLIWTALLSTGYEIYNNAQGLFYLSVPIIMITIGYQISKILTFRQILIYLVYTGTFLSLVYISIVLVKVGFVAFLAPYEEARFVVGSGSPASILSLIITGYSSQYGHRIFRNNVEKYVFIFVNILAIYLFASRTYWVILIIFLFLFNMKYIKKYQVMIFTAFCALILVLIIFPYRFTGDITTTKSLVYKMIKTFSEIKFSDYKTYSDINIHYRGYEAYRAFMTYLDGNLINLLFGHGFGKTIDLEESVYLAGSYRRIIPWIHNGYFFLLLKAGALGLIGLVIFFLNIFRIGYRNLEKDNTENRFMSLIIIGCVLSLILTNYVICSMFTIEMAIFMITIGIILQLFYVKNTECCQMKAE